MVSSGTSAARLAPALNGPACLVSRFNGRAVSAADVLIALALTSSGAKSMVKKDSE